MTLSANHGRPPRRRAIKLGGVALVVMVMVGAASTARASCGDYVVIGNPLRATQSQDISSEFTSVVPMRHSAPQPCHGPGCRQGAAFPPVPVSLVITSSPELAAMPPTGNPAVIADGESRLDMPGSRPVEGALNRVERPPRSAAQTPLGSWPASA